MPHDHDGHRRRMRERYRQTGLTGFQPHETLELLLFYAIPRRDVNPIAHRLLNHFGSVEAVLAASCAQLMQVEGIGENAATLISMVAPLWRYGAMQAQRTRARIHNYKTAAAYCQHLFAGKGDEVLFVICLDAQGRVLHDVPVIEGTIDEIPIYPRKVVEHALTHHAHAVVLAHNHPSGVAEPSQADIRATDELQQTLARVDIRLLDHLIWADGQCVSISRWRSTQDVVPLLGIAGRKAADTGPTARGRLGEAGEKGGFGEWPDG